MLATPKPKKLSLNKTSTKIGAKESVGTSGEKVCSGSIGNFNSALNLMPAKGIKNQRKVTSLLESTSMGNSKKSSIDQSKSILSAQPHPETRLLNSGHVTDSKKRALILSKEFKDEQEYKRVCTFHPTIYSTTAQSKYLDTSVRETAVDENVEWSFRPGISANSETYAKKYTSLNGDIVKRLTSKQTPREETNKTVMTARRKANPKEFLERQEKHEISKRQRLDCLAIETERHSPKISLRSQKIAAKLGNPRARIYKPKKTAVLNETTNWFKPSINPNSVSILEEAGRTRALRKPTSLKAGATTNQSEKHTHIFKSDPKNKVPSRLQLRSNIGTLMTRIQGNLTTRQMKGEQQKLRREIEEETECTHKPRLNKFPNYLKTHSKLNKTLCEKKEYKYLSLIHICRCRRYAVCRSRWSPYH
eukprot:TRINITY_DN3739_c0_g1_i18.p1 TRINITY_DN3739_c0_g1~~TRINITY_DN3739_c0_g1_i18.p1  ORF type:complete len:419 (-),score=102.05 TRINITY_DN3739_c0_g1_i18:13-1269(-)